MANRWTRQEGTFMTDRHPRVTVNETSTQEADCEPDSTVCGLRDVLDRIGDYLLNAIIAFILARAAQQK